jgi:hypothetical protein
MTAGLANSGSAKVDNAVGSNPVTRDNSRALARIRSVDDVADMARRLCNADGISDSGSEPRERLEVVSKARLSIETI